MTENRENNGGTAAGGGEKPQFREEYSFLGELRSEDGSVGIVRSGYRSDLSIRVEGGLFLDEVLTFIPPDESNPGGHLLRVTEGADGLVCIGEQGKWTVLDYPSKPAVLVTQGGIRRWLEIPDDDRSHLLGQKESGVWGWYRMADCEEDCD